jgi:hypothetical protein
MANTRSSMTLAAVGDRSRGHLFASVISEPPQGLLGGRATGTIAQVVFEHIGVEIIRAQQILLPWHVQ